MHSEKQRQTRRTVLAASGAVAAFGLAGCVGGDDSDGTEPNTGSSGSDDGETGQTGGNEQTVTLLVEGVGGHDSEQEHDDEDEHNHDGEEGHDSGHDYGHEGLTETEIGHACNHMAEVEEFGAEDVEAGGTADEAPHLSEVHHPYSVTFDGESGYVLFELGDHAHDGEEEEDGHEDEEHGEEDEHNHDEQEGTGGEMLAFFTQRGVSSVVEGELVYSETEAVGSCDPIDRYVIVETHSGSAVVELTAGV